MKQILTFLFNLILLLQVTLAQSQTFQQQADIYLSDLVKQGKFSGTVLVAQQGKILLSKGYGFAQKESSIQNTPQTMFRIGSITKPFTSVLIMQLVEKGKIGLDVPLIKYLPDIDEKFRHITVKQLLQHTSGISGYGQTPLTCSAFSQTQIDPLSFLSCLQELKVEFTPGTQFSYSNTNYFLLGVLLEKVTGQGFEELLESQILVPLKMTRTGYQTGETQSFAQGYSSQAEKLVPTMIKNITRAYAAGGMYSTVEDLYLFDQGLRSEKLLKKTTIRQVFAQNKAVEPSYYGFGWYVGPDAVKEDYRTFHEGGIEGFSACIDRYLNNEVCIIALSNYEFAEPRVDITEPLANILLKKK